MTRIAHGDDLSPQASLLMEAARSLRPLCTPVGEAMAAELAYPLIATYLLTGGRRTEVAGLELDDLSFDRQTVTFRPNEWRRLKTQTSWRVVPMWPQLAELLRPYVDRRIIARGGRLLFPGAIEGMGGLNITLRRS